MPELPPPLPEFVANQEPPQSVPTVQPASPKQRYRVAPLDDKVNCIIGSLVIFIVAIIGLNWMIQIELRAGRPLQSFIEREAPMMAGGIFASWLAVWAALSRSRWWARTLVFAGIALLFVLVKTISDSRSNINDFYVQLLLMTVILNAYLLLMSFMRFRIVRTQKLVIESSKKNDFVLIPKKCTPAEIASYADWHLYRKSSASSRMDAFRPMQFHLRQIFYVSIYVAIVCIIVRWTVFIMTRDSSIPRELGPDFITAMVIQLVCFVAPVFYLFTMLEMWVSLGKRRWLIKFLTLFCITFVIIFIYNFYSTFGITNLKVDFELTWDSIQPLVLIFCMMSMWMIVARCLGYRLIRLPLTINEKIGSESDPNIKSTF